MKSSEKPCYKAVALQYDPDRLPAPRVLARGAGKIAETIIAIGQEHQIPSVEDEQMVQLLYPLTPGEFIPESLYVPVAKLLAYFIYFKQNKFQQTNPPTE